jgi:hypothetical protein
MWSGKVEARGLRFSQHFNTYLPHYSNLKIRHAAQHITGGNKIHQLKHTCAYINNISNETEVSSFLAQ